MNFELLITLYTFAPQFTKLPCATAEMRCI